MKTRILAITCAIATIGIVNAATTITGISYILGTSGYATQVHTTPVSDTPYVGTYMIGTFTNTTGLGTAVGSINLADFGWSLFASANMDTTASRQGLFGANGATGTLPTTSGGPFIGRDIFIVIANAGNTDYIVWESSQQFATEVEGVGGAAVNIFTNASTLLRGVVIEDGNIGLTGAASSFNGQDAVTFGPIPETSTSLLGAIGALALLRRRRNA
jgi:hypothetical protein